MSINLQATHVLNVLSAAILEHEDWEIPVPIATPLATLIKEVVPQLINEVEHLQAEAGAAKIINDLAVQTEKKHGDKWQRLAGAYDEIRYAIRNAPDTPEGHAEFYNEAARLIFGDDQ